jgi:hypothetical protein
MVSEQIILSSGNNRLKLSHSESVTYYRLLVFVIISDFFLLCILMGQKATRPSIIWNEPNSNWVLFSPVLLFVALFIVLRNKLKLLPISTALQPAIVQMEIETLAESKGWRIEYKQPEAMIITSNLCVGQRMKDIIGEQQITIIFKENKLFINSRTKNNDPNIPFSFGQNSRNIKLIKKKIMDAEQLDKNED